MATRGFIRRGSAPVPPDRLPPGQFVTQDFPVLSAGPTPHVTLADWRFTLQVGPRPELDLGTVHPAAAHRDHARHPCQ